MLTVFCFTDWTSILSPSIVETSNYQEKKMEKFKNLAPRLKCHIMF